MKFNGIPVIVCAHVPGAWKMVIASSDFYCPLCEADVIAEAQAIADGEA
jgi:hypothetical protein